MTILAKYAAGPSVAEPLELALERASSLRRAQGASPEALIDVAAALMTPEDTQELAASARARSEAAAAYIASMHEEDATRQRVVRRVLDRVPGSVLKGSA
tara:strand:- start:481 stop:780 length:300 start_codon:yes stop_codon:yes gene_type:complete